MKVEIIVARNGLPKIGEVKEYPDRYALGLIQKGLAKLVGKKQSKKTTNTEGKTDEQEKGDKKE